MQDVYFMNKETGEILPSAQAFHEFYKSHKMFDSIFDEWDETDIPVENSTIEFPDFSSTKMLAHR